MISGSYPPMRCGVGDYTERLVSSLQRDAEVTTAVLTSTLPSAAEDSTDGRAVRTIRTWHASVLEGFREEMRRFQPDAVHIQFPAQGYDTVQGLVCIAAYVRLRLRLPVVVTLHEYLRASFKRLDAYIYALALLAHRIIVVRPEYHAHIPSLGKPLIRKSKIVFIANASSVPGCRLSAEQRASMKREMGAGDLSVVAFFGFSYAHKGVDLLFRIADPSRHHLLLIGELSTGDPYHRQLLELAASEDWKGKVTVTGFVEAARAARLLATADAVVFPYRDGGGIWNSSLHAAMNQDTFVLIASQERRGYDAEANVYFARPQDIEEMRKALLTYQGTRRQRELAAPDPWRNIARAHREVYLSLLGGHGERA